MGQNGPPCTPPGQSGTCFDLLLRPSHWWKVDAAITKLGWTSGLTSFSKWPPEKSYLAHIWPFIIARDKMLVSKPMFLRSRSTMVSPEIEKNFRYDISKWPPSKSYFPHISAYIIARDNILVSTPMFMMSKNTMVCPEIRMNFLYDVIFKMAAIEIIFLPISQLYHS